MLKITFFYEKYFKEKVFSVLILDQSIVSFSNFLLNISLARILGLESYGFFILVWSSIQFVITIQTSLIISPSQSFFPKIKLKDEKKKIY